MNEGILLAERGYAVLLPDLPGHGSSSGPSPNPDSFYFLGDFNKTSHFYISILAACRSYELLKGFSFVNQSKMAVSGVSYGAIISLALGAIYPAEIKGIFSMNAAGDFLSGEEYHLIWDVFNRSKDRFDPDWIKTKLPFVDPIYYIQYAPMYPKVTLYFGYYDEFFSRTGLNNTYNAINGEKYLIIRYLGRHNLINHTGPLNYFIDYCVNQGRAPPKYDSIHFSTYINGTDNGARVSIKLQSDSLVDHVIIRYLIEFWVSQWKEIRLNRSELTDINEINKIIHAGPLSANLTFILEFYQAGSDAPMFSSPIYILRLNNSSQIYYIVAIVICGLIALIIIISLRYNIFIKSLRDIQISKEIKGQFLLSNFIILCLESLLVFYGLVEPWITINQNVYIRFLHVLNVAPAYSDIFPFIKPDSGVNFYSAIIAMMFFVPLIPGALGVLLFCLGLFVMVGLPTMALQYGISGVEYTGIWGYLWLLTCFLIALTELILILKIRHYRTKLIERKNDS